MRFLILSLLSVASYAEQQPAKNWCRVHNTDVLMQHVEDESIWKDVGVTECHDEWNDVIYELLVTTTNDEPEQQHVHAHHSWTGKYLEYESEWTADEGILRVPSHTHTATSLYTWDEMARSNDHVRHHQRGRQLTHLVSTENAGKMIVARVVTGDENITNTAETIYGYIFDTNSSTSLASVHAGCTLQNKIIVPYNESTPVYELSLPGNVTNYTFGSFYAAAEPLLKQLLNITTDLNSVAEYVLLIAPNGLRPTSLQPNFRFVAAGAYDSYKSVVTDDWVDTPQVLQHELG